MHSVDHRDGPLPILLLTDSASRSSAELAPTRGGMITALSLAGRDVLYLDRKTLEDPTANVRGGIPVLFPSPGKLRDDTWSRDGARGVMKQHGFARNLPWKIVKTGTDDGAFATIALESSDATRTQYPWDFRAEFTYRLRGTTLSIEMRFSNTGSSPMPCGAGFHPYFYVPDAEKSAARIPTRATRAFDNKDKREIPFTGFDLTAPEVDLHLHDHGSTEASLFTGDVEIALRGSPEFTHWVVWTLRGRDFVCVEPWTCPGDALNTGDRLMVLAPGEARSLFLHLERR